MPTLTRREREIFDEEIHRDFPRVPDFAREMLINIYEKHGEQGLNRIMRQASKQIDNPYSAERVLASIEEHAKLPVKKLSDLLTENGLDDKPSGTFEALGGPDSYSSNSESSTVGSEEEQDSDRVPA